VTWTRVTVFAPTAADLNAAAALLIAAGAAGVQEVEEGLVTFLATNVDMPAIGARLSSTVPSASMVWEPVGEIPIDTSWTANVGVQRLGGITVAPPWLSDQAGDGLIVVVDPGAAFGTGDHESTRLVLRLMQDVIRPGDHVADLGAGSGVLSIAAAMLGAASVAAIELDSGSINNAEENVYRNAVGARVKVIEGDAAVLLPLVAPVQVVLANIISSVIKDLSAVMRAALSDNGRAVLGGVLRSERDDLVDFLERNGWELLQEAEEGEWWSGEITPR
jgi:ribosomal protein L11 methyltransferase